MTEEEAKTKWCHRSFSPFIAGGEPMPTHPGFVTQDRGGHFGMRCIGSACAGWRWGDAFPLPHDPPAISDRYKGYCGLAGKP